MLAISSGSRTVSTSPVTVLPQPSALLRVTQSGFAVPYWVRSSLM